MKLEQKLKELELELPKVSTPGGNYVSVNIRGNIAYVAIQFPIINEGYYYQGRLWDEISTEEGYNAMEMCALNVITQIEAKVGFDNVTGLNHIDAYFQAGNQWDDSPKIVNGASDTFVNILGDKGTHSRAIFGVDSLPRNFSVGLTATFTINNWPKAIYQKFGDKINKPFFLNWLSGTYSRNNQLKKAIKASK